MIPAIFAHTHFNPLDPKIKIGILICCPDLIPTEVSGEKLLKYQANSSCVIMSVILMTTLFYISIDIKRRNLMPISSRA